MWRSTTALLAATLPLLVLAGTARAADGESAPDAASGADGDRSLPFNRAPDSLYQRARSAYNDENYERAVDLYIQAIQLTPDRPKLYRDLGRAYFWTGTYARAVVYYDDYIRLSDESADLENIRSERKLAASRAGKDVWTLPEIQKDVLEALRDELAEGAAYTEGGGGAWGLYRTLLRTGYARPALATLQDRVFSRLIGEFRQRLKPEDGGPTPALGLDGWQLQAERLAAARRLANGDERSKTIERNQRTVDAALALLNSEHEGAVEATARAVQANSGATFLRWFHIAALIDAERHAAASRELGRIENALETGRERDYLRVLEALVAQRRDRHGDAAELYRQLFLD